VVSWGEVISGSLRKRERSEWFRGVRSSRCP
jgi:hypothetical protein